MSGPFEGDGRIEPARLGLKAGDRVQYWAEAEDNKEPEAGLEVTERQVMLVVGPEKQRQSPPENAGQAAAEPSKAGPQGENPRPGEKAGQETAGPIAKSGRRQILEPNRFAERLAIERKAIAQDGQANQSPKDNEKTKSAEVFRNRPTNNPRPTNRARASNSSRAEEKERPAKSDYKHNEQAS